VRTKTENNSRKLSQKSKLWNNVTYFRDWKHLVFYLCYDIRTNRQEQFVIKYRHWKYLWAVRHRLMIALFVKPSSVDVLDVSPDGCELSSLRKLTVCNIILNTNDGRGESTGWSQMWYNIVGIVRSWMNATVL